MLQYILVDNILTLTPNDCMGQAVNVRSYNMEQIIERILGKYPGLTPAQIKSVLDEFVEEVCRIIEEGSNINTPLFNIQLSISGVFDGVSDNFDSSRHSVKANISAGTRTRQSAKKVKTQKTTVPDPIPLITEVSDTLSNTVNDIITGGGVIQIRGSRLKILPEETNNGIFLIDDKGVETKLTTIVDNKPSRLIVMLPATLEGGTYSLEVRTSFSSSGRPAKNLKTGRFSKDLYV